MCVDFSLFSDKPVHRQLPVKLISLPRRLDGLAILTPDSSQVSLHIDKEQSPIVIYRFAVNYSFVSAWEKKPYLCNELRFDFSFQPMVVKNKVCI